MKHLTFTLPVLKHMASLPGGKAELRKKRDEAQKIRARVVADHDKNLAKLDQLIENMGVALGEVQA